MITVIQLTFLETYLMFGVWENCLYKLIQMFTYSKSYLKKHGTSNLSLAIANDRHWLELERNQIQKL